MSDNAKTDGVTLTIFSKSYAISAAVWLQFNEMDEDVPTAAHFCNQLVTEHAQRHVLDAPIPAARQYVIYWPGVLEIPWPEGMIAQEAVAAWKENPR